MTNHHTALDRQGDTMATRKPPTDTPDTSADIDTTRTDEQSTGEAVVQPGDAVLVVGTDTSAPPTSSSHADDAVTPAPVGDEHGRVRVRDLDTGHQLSIHVAALPHGNYEVLDEPASTPAGDAVPVVHHESPVEPTTDGHQAETKE